MSLIPSGFSKNAAGGASFYDHPIEQSLRFNDSDNPYLSRTPSSTGNRKTWTWSGWLKRGSDFTNQYIFDAFVDANNRDFINWNGSVLRYRFISGGTSYQQDTVALFRDPNAWYHIVWSVDTTQATAANRSKLYVNGVLQSYTGTEPTQNLNTSINNTVAHNIGRYGGGSYNLDGYLAEVHFIDGTALDPTSFGETKSGVWIPKAYAGSYGTNGFYQKYSNSGSLGADSSGNGNNFTATNLAATDVVLDSPTNNFATWNVLANVNGDTFSEGNLKVLPAFSPYSYTPSSIGTSSSKVYAEFYVGATSNFDMFGIVTTVSTGTTIYIGQSSEAWGYRGWTGQIINGGSVSSYGNTFTTGDIVGIAVDLDNGYLYFSKNGTWQNSADPTSGSSGTGGINISSISGKDIFFAYSDYDISSTQAVYIGNFGQDSSFAGNKVAQGNTDANGYGDFFHSVPSGYLALCTANLSLPDAMNPALDASPQDHFNTVLYTGNGSTNAITGVGFQPDFTWIKSRSNAFVHALYDSVRGATKNLISNNTDSEYTYSTGLNAFNTDGFSLGNLSWVNFNTDSFVSWNWKANGSGVSNTDGTITSTVSANTDAGFSIVSYTGNSTNGATIGHGLTQTPDFIVVKCRSTSGPHWAVHHQANGYNKALYLDLLNAASSNTAYFQNASSTTFTLGTQADVNYSGRTYIAYCFHDVEGFSKFGSYTGNGSTTDGPFVYTGFRPAWILHKNVTTGSTYWGMLDATRNIDNEVDLVLQANSSAAESQETTRDFDFLSNGFKIRGGNTQINTSGNTYIYAVFAENPFKYANAR